MATLNDLVAAQTDCRRLEAALRRLVREGTDGRWYTSQHGDADVTAIVGGVLSSCPQDSK